MGYRWKRARLSLKSFRNQEEFDLKQQQIKTLIELDKDNYIDLYFADESHFGLTPNVPYAWQTREQAILLPASKSQKISLFGLMTMNSKLQAYSCTGSLNSQSLIAYMDDFVSTITKKTVVVMDNAPIHRSKTFKAKIPEWRDKDLYIFFLPPYSPELNKIEILWRFIKYKWIPLDAFLNFKNLKERLNQLIQNIGTKYVINFY